MWSQPTQCSWQEAVECWAQATSQWAEDMQNQLYIFLNWCSAQKKKIANIHRLPSYCIKARLEQWLSLTTGLQVTFGTPLLNQWLMGHGGWLGRYEKVCIMTVCRVFLSPTHVPTHLPRTCTQAGTQTLNEKQGQIPGVLIISILTQYPFTAINRYFFTF